MAKPKKATVPAIRDPATLTVPISPGEDKSAAIARASLAPQYQAARTAREYSPLPKDKVSIDALAAELIKRSADAVGGNLARGEAMLASQAHALDAIFHECARRARLNMGEHPQATEMYLRQAMRAQSNCRATWETLAAIKSPPNATFVRQANIANGPQQVNNGQAPPRAEKVLNAQTKLLEADSGQRLDTRAPGATGAANQELEAVGTVHRTEDGGR